MLGIKLRHAFRSIRKNPLLALVAVISLGLGIGANTAIFSLIDQLLLRMLPVQNPRELVQLAARGSHYGSNWGSNAMSYPMYRDFRDRNPVFTGLLCRFGTPLSLGYGGETERVEGELVSGNYFQVLGVRAALGRTFTPEDDLKPGAHPVAMLSYAFWQARFAADPAIVGRSINLNGYAMTVVGVAAPGFHGVEIGDATQVFVPVLMQKEMAPVMGRYYKLEDRRGRWVNVFARLLPGVTLAKAKAALALLYKQIIEMEVQEAAFRNASEFSRQRFLESRMEVFDGATGRSNLRRQFTTPLYVLLALTGLVLVIACANVANLLMARATAREKEIAVRLALGASRGQIVGQLLVESLLVSLGATALGLWVASWLVRFLLTVFASETPQLMITAELDPRILGFSMALGFATALLFGLAPALQAVRPRLAETLQYEARSVLGGGHGRFRRALVVAQVGLSLLLLMACGLFVRSLANLKSVDPGFRVEQLVSFSIDPPTSGYSDERTRAFYQELRERLSALPFVESAGHGVMRVLDGNEWDSTVTVEGYQAQQGENMNPHFNAVSPGYFATLGIPLLSGRDFSVADASSAAKVCVVNETFARKYFSGGEAVGRHIGQGGDPDTPTDMQIIGVVKDANYETLREVIPRQVFIPFHQMENATGVVFYVRTTEEPTRFFGTVRAVIRELDGSLPVYALRTLEQQVDLSLVAERMIASLSLAFGGVASALAAIGLYGVMAFTVARRAPEIGIRIALGAQSRNVIGMVMREVGLLVLMGVAIAVPCYFALAGFVRSQLYGIGPSDPVSLTAAALVLSLLAGVAGYLPARRAARVDPLRVLRTA